MKWSKMPVAELADKFQVVGYSPPQSSVTSLNVLNLTFADESSFRAIFPQIPSFHAFATAAPVILVSFPQNVLDSGGRKG